MGRRPAYRLPDKSKFETCKPYDVAAQNTPKVFGGFLEGLFEKSPSKRIPLLVKRGVKGVDILAVEFVHRKAQRIAEALVVNDLALAQELDGIADVGVVDHTKDVVVGHARLLLWCNHIRTNFSEIPMNFYGNIPCSGDSLADRYVINQRFHDFAVKVFQVCVLFNEFAAVITNRNFVVDFG